jgi:hypothetical protein
MSRTHGPSSYEAHLHLKDTWQCLQRLMLEDREDGIPLTNLPAESAICEIKFL